MIERLRRNGQGGGKERQKVWLVEASRANMFPGGVGGKPSFRKGERRRKLEMYGKVKFWDTWDDKLKSLSLGFKRQDNKCRGGTAGVY